MTTAMIALVPIGLGILVLLTLILRGHSISSAKISLPFAEMNLERFKGLSPVQLFSDVSMACLPEKKVSPDSIQSKMLENSDPIILIHVGWNIVCEAFVKQFEHYPDDQNINQTVKEIGGQNVDFIKMYRNIHKAAVRDSKAVKREFAANYLLRAPSMAERISGKSNIQDQFVRDFLREAEAIIKK